MAPNPSALPVGSGPSFFFQPMKQGEEPEVTTMPIPRCPKNEESAPEEQASHARHECLLRQQYVRTNNHKVELLTEIPKKFESVEETNDRLPFIASARNLEAAKAYLEDIFFISFRLDDVQKAQAYLDANLANACPAYFPKDLPYGEVISPGIYPLEDCYKTQLFRLRVLSITNPGEAMALAQQLEVDLNDEMTKGRQRVEDTSAAGYLNQVNLFKLYAAYYNLGTAGGETLTLDAAIELADKSAAWSLTQSERWYAGLFNDHMDRRDCIYDALNARLAKGMLQAKAGKLDEAIKTFGELLNEPAAIRKYGGYLDIALQSFFNILYLSLYTSDTVAEAAQKFDKAIDSTVTWAALNDDNHKDLREALGLLVRKGEWLPDDNPIISLDDIGKIGQNFGSLWSWMIPVDESATVSEIKLSDYPTPEEKLSLFVDKMLPFVQIRNDFKSAINGQYYLLRDYPGGEQ